MLLLTGGCQPPGPTGGAAWIVPDAETETAPSADASLTPAPDVPPPPGDSTALADAAVAADTPVASADVAAPHLRDWQVFPAIAQRGLPADLWFLGDVHGDDKRLRKLLAANGLASDAGPSSSQWLAGTAVLVCVGDLIDKGSDSLAVLARLRSLQAQAAQQGGEVIVTLGNHEAEFLADPLGSKTLEFRAELLAKGLDPAAVAAGSQEPGPWLRQLPLAVRLGDWFACHAGNTHGLSMDQLTQALQTGLDSDGFASTVLQDPNSLLEARLDPPWWQGGASKPKAALQANLTALGVAHLVQGHQPQEIVFSDGSKRKAGQIYQRWGLIFLVDAGMSQAVDASQGALLHVQGSSAEVRSAAGEATALWP